MRRPMVGASNRIKKGVWESEAKVGFTRRSDTKLGGTEMKKPKSLSSGAQCAVKYAKEPLRLLCHPYWGSFSWYKP